MTAVQLSLLEGRQWSPRFVAYAASRGLAPEDVPVGHGADFINWMSSEWALFADEHGIKVNWPGQWTEAQHDKFDAWQAERWIR